MIELVFMLEEASMAELLKAMLPPLIPEGVVCRYIAHEGKSDLERSIPRKLRAWRTQGVQFVVVRDQDQQDCVQLKSRLLRMCSEAGRPDTLVRIVCHSLEAWYLGDLAAVGAAYRQERLSRQQNRQRFRDPDNLGNPEQILKQLIPQYQKVIGARMIAGLLDVDNNRSHSFNVFIQGVRRIVADIAV